MRSNSIRTPVCLFIYLSIYLSVFHFWNDISLYWINGIFKEREISYQKQRTDRRQTNTQMLEIKDTSFTYKGQLSTDQDDRKLGLMLIIPFPVWTGIRIIPARTGNGTKFNSSRNRKQNYEKIWNCKINLSVNSWPLKRKDMQLLIDEEFYVLPSWRSVTNWQTSFTICVHFHSFISGLGWN